MSQLAEVIPIQEELFTFKMHKPQDGALLFSNVRNVALPHAQTAELMKYEGLGLGRKGRLKAGDGEFVKFSIEAGRAVWTFRVDDVEIEL